MIQPKRFHKQDIDKQLFENFLKEFLTFIAQLQPLKVGHKRLAFN